MIPANRSAIRLQRNHQRQPEILPRVQAPDMDIVAEVSDFTANPPQYGKYEAFKTRVLRTFQDSEEKRLKTLLHEELGDQRPSRFLKRLKELAEDNASDELLKLMWTQRLPLNMQIILAVCGDDLDKLAIVADKIHDITAPSVSSREVAATTTGTPSLQNQIDEITRRLDHLTSSRQREKPRWRGRSRSSSRIRSASPGFGHCWYHRRFGREARRCLTPCSWKNQKTARN